MKKHLAVSIFLAISLMLGLGINSQAEGLTVSGGKIDAKVKPGEAYIYTMEVRNTSENPIDIQVESKGYGTAGGSSFLALEPLDDQSRYSARELLTVSPSTFYLESGKSQTITISANIAAGIGEGGRYAIIFIQTMPGNEAIAMVSAVAARVLLTIENSQLIHQSEITAVETGRTKPGTISVTIENTGNHHYKPHLTAKLIKAGEVIAAADEEDSWPLIPGYNRQIDLSFSGNGMVPAGEYEVEIEVRDDSGNISARRTASTKMEAFDAASTHASGTPGRRTVEFMPVSIILSPTGAAVLASESEEIWISFPQGAVTSQAELWLTSQLPDSKQAPPAGFILTDTCFEVAGLNGLLAKEATVKVKYSAAELEKAGGDDSRLALARWDASAGRWEVIETAVDQEKMTLTAKTTRFSTWVVIVKPAGSGFQNTLPVIGVVLVIEAGVLIAAAAVVWRRNRHSAVK